METYTTRLGTTAVIVNGYKFKINRKTKSTIIWKCSQRKCKSKCTTDLSMTTLLREPETHDHPTVDNSVFVRDRVRAECKRKASDQLNERASKIVCTEAAKATNEKMQRGNDYYSAKNNNRTLAFEYVRVSIQPCEYGPDHNVRRSVDVGKSNLVAVSLCNVRPSVVLPQIHTLVYFQMPHRDGKCHKDVAFGI